MMLRYVAEMSVVKVTAMPMTDSVTTMKSNVFQGSRKYPLGLNAMSFMIASIAKIPANPQLRRNKTFSNSSDMSAWVMDMTRMFAMMRHRISVSNDRLVTTS